MQRQKTQVSKSQSRIGASGVKDHIDAGGCEDDEDGESTECFICSEGVERPVGSDESDGSSGSEAPTAGDKVDDTDGSDEDSSTAEKDRDEDLTTELHRKATSQFSGNRPRTSKAVRFEDSHRSEQIQKPISKPVKQVAAALTKQSLDSKAIQSSEATEQQNIMPCTSSATTCIEDGSAAKRQWESEAQLGAAKLMKQVFNGESSRWACSGIKLRNNCDASRKANNTDRFAEALRSAGLKVMLQDLSQSDIRVVLEGLILKDPQLVLDMIEQLLNEGRIVITNDS